MSGPARIVSEAAQSFSFSRRAMVVGGGQAALGLVLAGRMGWLSIAENERYALLADSNRINITLIPPRRGWIVDRNGAPIASNRTDFRVDLIPDRIEDKERVVGQLRDLLALNADDVERIWKALRDSVRCRSPKISIGNASPRSACGSPNCPAYPRHGDLRVIIRRAPPSVTSSAMSVRRRASSFWKPRTR
jgi:penicillin-binding protein 2